MLQGGNLPRFTGLRQFSLNILSLEEEPDGVGRPESLCISEELGEGSACPRRHHIEGLGGRVLDADISDFDFELETRRDLRQEAAFLRRRLEQDSSEPRPAAQEFRQHETGKAGAGAEIGQGSGVLGNEGKKLGRIKKVPAPEVFQGRVRHQIVDRVPMAQQVGIEDQPSKCFT